MNNRLPRLSLVLWWLISSAAVASPVPASPARPDGDQRRDRAADRNDAQQDRRDRDNQRDGQEFTDRVTRTVQADPAGEIEISNVAGNISITGRGDREIRIEAIKRVRGVGDEAEAKRQLALLDVEVIQRGPRVEIRTNNWRGRRGLIDYNVTVPSTMTVTLKSVSGDLSVNDVKGEVRLQTVNGDVRAGSTPRLAFAKSVSGEVILTSVAADGDLTVGSVSGSISARGLKARGLDLETVSGDLTLIDVTCERVSLRTVSGDLAYTGPLAKGGRYQFTLHSGDVRVTVTNQTGFELKASSFSGEIHTSVPITLRPSDASTDNSRGRPRTRAVTGIYGDGSALLEITTFSGDVVISKGR